ncbi:Putative peptidase [Kitasatospora sp. MMS16-BH015]|uniref:M23 family metallopeptidase n=1 Tax=Kitasatospora sp. MMS16-BH015 TaxID=2018025 RepID=UPI000CA2B1D5|nr:M23 family metallopeptidase [Kitasatospora sp. MMS16-BH015]AUG79021.1 Putative peptidase [Kitasatospora sp. MMS16-BH015]
MASTHSPAGPATQLLDGPTVLPPLGDEVARHRMPRQARTGGPLLGVTAMAASLGATGFAAAGPAAAAPLPAAPVTTPDAATEDSTELTLSADPGLALAARIQQQADGQRTAAEETARVVAAQEAEAKRAAQQAEARAETERTAVTLPVAGYTLTAHYGQAGSYWSHLHTGLDFAAPTGTPAVAVAAGTVTSAGWAGAYGYRVVLTLPDGTELWYCHLSAITTTAGPVTPGTQLGRVGATGNVTGPHLHLEVRPAAGAPIDPLPWLHARGLQP